MSASSFDQRAWLDRIGQNGSREPTLGTLHQPIFAHSQAIAYESLDIMLGRTPRLDLVSLQRKMIFGGRGGYCLEQNMLYREELRSLGYKITSLQGNRDLAPRRSWPSQHGRVNELTFAPSRGVGRPRIARSRVDRPSVVAYGPHPKKREESTWNDARF